MKITRITLNVAHPDHLQPDEVAAAINQLLNVGLADAQDTVADEDFDNPDARLVVALEIGQPHATAVE